MSTQRLAGKVAVVTGASKGIGAAVARQLAREGAAVVVNYASSASEADRVAADISAGGGKAVAVQADVRKASDIERLFAETLRAFDALDVLVNNAGAYEVSPVGTITEEHFHRLFDLNVLSLILTSQEAIKHMNAAGGSIVNMSSIVGDFAPPNLSVYNATKAAVDALTRTMAKELAPRNIRVNSINPGMIETEGLHATGFAANREAMAAVTPLGRIGTPEDIAPGVAFLASSDSAWMTGETLYITGGLR